MFIPLSEPRNNSEGNKGGRDFAAVKMITLELLEMNEHLY